jgi:uncharacterized membrane protein HdeD (DUF308 family)
VNVNFKQAYRAAISFGLGIFITFNQAHGPDVGLTVLGVYGVALGLGLTALTLTKKADLSALQELPVAVLALLVGLFSLLALGNQPTQLPAFLALVAAWGLISGAFELYQGRRSGFKTQNGKDFMISAVFGLLLGLLFLAVPLDSVSAVGFFGAYLAMSGVHLGIAAASSKKPK